MKIHKWPPNSPDLTLENMDRMPQACHKLRPNPKPIRR